MCDLNKVLGKALAEYRRARGLSQEALALECELHPTYISQIERGIKSPTIRTIFIIAEILQVRPSEILALVEANLKRR